MAHDPANSTPHPNHNSSDEWIGYLNGLWLPQHEMKLSVADDGFRFAATAVERLRTYHGKVFQLPAHLDRWRRTLVTIGIDKTPDDAAIYELIQELLDRNQGPISRSGDVSITMVATPGQREAGAFRAASSTFLLHLNTIDHKRVFSRRTTGQPLIMTNVVQPPPESWPRDAKVRCRLHYYLADKFARRRHADAQGVLLDQDGSITETSISNIAIVKNRSILSPPQDRILGGITQRVIQSIVAKLGISWAERPITNNELLEADEVLLMGTDSGIWFGNRVDETPMPAGPIYAQLLQAFDEFVAAECSATNEHDGPNATR